MKPTTRTQHSISAGPPAPTLAISGIHATTDAPSAHSIILPAPFSLCSRQLTLHPHDNITSPQPSRRWPAAIAQMIHRPFKFKLSTPLGSVTQTNTVVLLESSAYEVLGDAGSTSAPVEGGKKVRLSVGR